MHGGEPPFLLFIDHISAVAHAERAEDVVLEVDIDALAASLLDQLPNPIHAHAVFPALVRIADQRCMECREFAGESGRVAGLVDIALHVGVPNVFAEAGCMGEEIAERDRALRRAHDRIAIAVKVIDDLRLTELWDHFARRAVEIELALLDELHGGDSRDRLCHGGDPEHGIEGHRRAIRQTAFAEGALIDDPCIVGRHRDHAGYAPLGGGIFQDLVDLRPALHVSPMLAF
jgi:hypothetical protein